jgi:hypothetical protein
MLNMELKNAQIVKRPCYSLKMNFRVGLPMRFLPTKKESNTTFVRNGNLFFYLFFPIGKWSKIHYFGERY